jgi:hypothetical protein
VARHFQESLQLLKRVGAHALNRVGLIALEKADELPQKRGCSLLKWRIKVNPW